jgi:hypothetical protein
MAQRGRRLPGVAAAAVAVLLAGALGAALLGGRGLPGWFRPQSGAGGAAARPVLTWAVADLAVAPDGTALVELTVVVDNPGAWSTSSTSILWEPAFAQVFTLTESEPDPWRARIDERGWGVLDTHGVLPRRSGSFRLRFTAAPDPTGAPLPSQGAFRTPRLVVVVDGAHVIAESAGDVRRGAPPPGRWLRAFERGPLARLADAVPSGVAVPHHAFGFAVGLAALLGLVAGGGAAAAFGSTVTVVPVVRRTGPAQQSAPRDRQGGKTEP